MKIKVNSLINNKNFRNNQNYVISNNEKIRILNYILIDIKQYENKISTFLIDKIYIFLKLFILLVLFIIFSYFLELDKDLFIILIIVWLFSLSIYYFIFLINFEKNKSKFFILSNKIKIFRKSFTNVKKFNTKYIFDWKINWLINFDVYYSDKEMKNRKNIERKRIQEIEDDIFEDNDF